MEAHIAIRIVKLSDFIALCCLNSKWHSELSHPSVAARALLNVYPPYYATCKLLNYLSTFDSPFVLKILEFIIKTENIPLSPTVWTAMMGSDKALKLFIQIRSFTKEQLMDGLCVAVSMNSNHFKMLMEHFMTTVPYAEISVLLTRVIESAIKSGNNEALEYLLKIVHLPKSEWRRLALSAAVHQSNFDAIRLIHQYTHSMHSQFLSDWAMRIQHYPLLKEFSSDLVVHQLQISHVLFCSLIPSMNRWYWLIFVLIIVMFIPLTVIALVNTVVAIILVYMIRNRGICHCMN